MAHALLRPHETSTAEGRARERYRRVALSITSGIAGRAAAAAAGLLTAPLLLGYLGKERFGLYSAIIATVPWLSLLEMGIASGLVNAVSEAHGRGDRRAAAEYLTTALAALTVVAAAIGLVFVVVGPRLSWETVFGAAGVVAPVEVRGAVIAAGAAILIGLPLAVTPSVYAGYQQAYVTNMFVALSSAASLLAVWTSIRLHLAFPALVGVVSASPVAVGVLNLLVLVGAWMPWLRIRLSQVSRRAGRRIARTSAPLFFFQIGALMVNQSQLFILTHTATLATTADYAVIIRIVQIFSGVILLTTSAFFPAYREAVERGDRLWLRDGFRRMLAVRMGLATTFAALIVLAGNGLLRLWLQRGDVQFSMTVWVLLGLHLIASAWVSAHSELLTVLDRIWVQVGLVLANGAATVLLTLWLSPRHGVLGVLAAAAFTTIVGWTWVFPLLPGSVLKPRRTDTR